MITICKKKSTAGRSGSMVFKSVPRAKQLLYNNQYEQILVSNRIFAAHICASRHAGVSQTQQAKSAVVKTCS